MTTTTWFRELSELVLRHQEISVRPHLLEPAVPDVNNPPCVTTDVPASEPIDRMFAALNRLVPLLRDARSLLPEAMDVTFGTEGIVYLEVLPGAGPLEKRCTAVEWFASALLLPSPQWSSSGSDDDFYSAQDGGWFVSTLRAGDPA